LNAASFPFLASQEPGGDVPLLVVRSEDSGCFFIQADDAPLLGIAGIVLERDHLAYVESAHRAGALVLGYQFQAFNDESVEVAKLLFAELLDEGLDLGGLEGFRGHGTAFLR